MLFALLLSNKKNRFRKTYTLAKTKTPTLNIWTALYKQAPQAIETSSAPVRCLAGGEIEMCIKQTGMWLRFLVQSRHQTWCSLVWYHVRVCRIHVRYRAKRCLSFRRAPRTSAGPMRAVGLFLLLVGKFGTIFFFFHFPFIAPLFKSTVDGSTVSPSTQGCYTMVTLH